MTLVLDAGGITVLATSRARLAALRSRGLWPAKVPAVVLAESLTGDHRRDFEANRLLKACQVRDVVELECREAARLRTATGRAGTVSAVDAVVVAVAATFRDPVVLTSDPDDLSALAGHCRQPIPSPLCRASIPGRGSLYGAGLPTEAPMHELAITQSVVDTIAERTSGAQVTLVRLDIGKLSGVVPDAVAFCFDLVANGTPLDGAKLEISEPPGRAQCRTCSTEFELDSLILLCPCGSADVVVLAGRELAIRSVEVA